MKRRRPGRPLRRPRRPVRPRRRPLVRREPSSVGAGVSRETAGGSTGRSTARSVGVLFHVKRRYVVHGVSSGRSRGAFHVKRRRLAPRRSTDRPAEALLGRPSRCGHRVPGQLQRCCAHAVTSLAMDIIQPYVAAVSQRGRQRRDRRSGRSLRPGSSAALRCSGRLLRGCGSRGASAAPTVSCSVVVATGAARRHRCTICGCRSCPACAAPSPRRPAPRRPSSPLRATRVPPSCEQGEGPARELVDPRDGARGGKGADSAPCELLGPSAVDRAVVQAQLVDGASTARSCGAASARRGAGAGPAARSPGPGRAARRRTPRRPRRRPSGKASCATAQFRMCRSQRIGTSRGPIRPWMTPVSARIAANRSASARRGTEDHRRRAARRAPQRGRQRGAADAGGRGCGPDAATGAVPVSPVPRPSSVCSCASCALFHVKQRQSRLDHAGRTTTNRLRLDAVGLGRRGRRPAPRRARPCARTPSSARGRPSRRWP